MERVFAECLTKRLRRDGLPRTGNRDGAFYTDLISNNATPKPFVSKNTAYAINRRASRAISGPGKVGRECLHWAVGTKPLKVVPSRAS